MTAPLGEPPLEALPPDAPATVEDVRASRRWTWVALAWAVAASAIAVLALIHSNDNNNSSTATQTQTTQDLTPRLDNLQKQTNDRLDAFSRRLDKTAAGADVQKLDKRLTQAENTASQAKDASTKQAPTITQLQSDVKDLQQRVSALEKQQQQQSQTGTTTTP
jgi:septal ring factor EnvC (AmiA/AmiB activator)